MEQIKTVLIVVNLLFTAFLLFRTNAKRITKRVLETSEKAFEELMRSGK